MSLFFRAKLSCNIFTFILKNSIKAVELEKKKKKHQIRLSLNHSSKTTQYPTTEQTLVSFFQPAPSPVLSLRCVFFSIFQSSPTQYLSAGKGQTYYTSPNKTAPTAPRRVVLRRLCASAAIAASAINVTIRSLLMVILLSVKISLNCIKSLSFWEGLEYPPIR